MAYQLAPQLQQDCIIIANWSLCDVLLMNDAQYPWFILVPGSLRQRNHRPQ